jgi:flagellar M-ring protein FliF
LNNFRQFFSKFWTQISGFWTQLSLSRKITIGAVLAMIVFATAMLLATKETNPMEYVFVDLSPEDSAAITSWFRQANYSGFIVDQKGIKVPVEDVMRLRLQLSQEGLPAHGQVGWEKFDTQEFARTEFEQQINKMRAIQGELGRTIQAIEGITSARVHIVVPKESVFVEDKKDPTAAVYLRTKRGVTLEDRQIKGIQHLVSRSVEGLKPNNITIIDGDGKMLTKIEAEDFASKMTKEMLAYKQQVEKEIEEKIRTIVGRVVGADRVEAKVDATVDFTQEERTTSDVDPDRSAVISRNIVGESLQGSGLNPTGIPGAKSNVPSEQEPTPAAGGGNTIGNKRDSELVNFEVAKTLSKKTMPVGTVTRLTAAVLVDGKQVQLANTNQQPPFEPRTPEEMTKIEALVKKAMGFRDGRDEVQVHNMMFQLDHVQVQAITQEKQEKWDKLAAITISGTVAFSLMLFFAFIVRPYFRWLSYDPERKKDQSIVEEFKADLETSGIHNVQAKEEVPFEKLSPQEQILYLAKHDPKRTTEALRMLLNPHQTAH